jgi:hypothetical protein
VPGVSEFTDRRASQVESHAPADFTHPRTSQPGLFLIEPGIAEWERFNRGVDELDRIRPA